MPRIRTIKPEFWDSPGTARASLRGRLFFIALWNWADDYGVGTANPGQLIAFAFPNDDLETRTEFPRLRTEVSDCFDVQWYTVDSRPFYSIPSWENHQKNERRAKGRFPGPDQADSFDAEMRGNSVSMHGSSGTGTGEQGTGNRGTDSKSPDESDDSGDLIPQDWRPNQTHQDKAASLHLDVVREYHRFRDHAERTHRRLQGVKGWNAGFTNWLRKAAEFNQQRGAAQPVQMSKAARNAAEYQRLFGGDHERPGSIQALDAGVGA